MVDKQLTQAHHGMLRDLGGGLILCRASREDAEELDVGVSPYGIHWILMLIMSICR
jgi:hypothetical protein